MVSKNKSSSVKETKKKEHLTEHIIFNICGSAGYFLLVFSDVLSTHFHSALSPGRLTCMDFINGLLCLLVPLWVRPMRNTDGRSVGRIRVSLGSVSPSFISSQCVSLLDSYTEGHRSSLHTVSSFHASLFLPLGPKSNKISVITSPEDHTVLYL